VTGRIVLRLDQGLGWTKPLVVAGCAVCGAELARHPNPTGPCGPPAGGAARPAALAAAGGCPGRPAWPSTSPWSAAGRSRWATAAAGRPPVTPPRPVGRR
jgi:hypothetical protein